MSWYVKILSEKCPYRKYTSTSHTPTDVEDMCLHTDNKSPRSRCYYEVCPLVELEEEK
jgi:hypothetical protein